MRLMIRRTAGGITNIEIPFDARFEEILARMDSGELAAVYLRHAGRMFTIESPMHSHAAKASTEQAREAS